MKKLPALLAALAIGVFSLGLVACGDDDDDGGDTSAETSTEATTTEAAGGGGGAAATLDISSPEDGSTSYDTDNADVAAGELTINYDNPSQVPHDVKVEDDSGTEIGGTELVSEETGTASVTLEPGTYTFFCSVPGHRESGMEGTITAK